MTLAGAAGSGVHPGDRPGALSRSGDVADAGKPPAQFDGGRKLAMLIEDGTDRGRSFLGDDEHGGQHGDVGGGGQANRWLIDDASPLPPFILAFITVT